MATTTKSVKKPLKKVAGQEPEKKLTPTQMRKKIEELEEEVEKLNNSTRCSVCGKLKNTENNFHKSSDPTIGSGHVHVCKRCLYLIAHMQDAEGNLYEPTKASVMRALEYMDKPFLTRIWDSSYWECQGENSRKSDIWASYTKNVAMPQYEGLRWKDSDIFKSTAVIGKLDAALPSSMEEEEYEKERQAKIDAMHEAEVNRQDCISIIGYDPFVDYPDSADLPMLYSSIISFLDEEAKNDGMKIRAIIQIVKTYNQIEKINKNIDGIVSSPDELTKNTAALDKLASVVSRLNSSAVNLAKDNGISVNHNNNKSKGASTLSGKIKMLKEIGFRDAKINSFDVATCEGMRQVAELSEEARHKQIGYDENIAQEIKDIKVQLVEQLTKEKEAALETVRKLLVENMDLKEALGERHV